MPRRRFQQGCLRIEVGMWFLRFWRDEIRDGVRVRANASKRLGPICLSKLQARKLAQPILDEVNNPNAGIPVRDMTRGIILAEFIPEGPKHAAGSLKKTNGESRGGSDADRDDALRCDLREINLTTLRLFLWRTEIRELGTHLAVAGVALGRGSALRNDSRASEG